MPRAASVRPASTSPATWDRRTGSTPRATGHFLPPPPWKRIVVKSFALSGARILTAHGGLLETLESEYLQMSI
jgi:hypothetical protein